MSRDSKGGDGKSEYNNGNGHWKDAENKNNEAQEEDDDDYYVYTYKGDSKENPEHLADLPSSFFKFHPSECQAGSSSSLLRKDGSSDNDPNRTSVTNGVTCVVTNGNGHSCGSLSFSQPFGCLTSNHCSGRVASHGESSENFSPDMDFLEMDFDPGGTGEDVDNSCESDGPIPDHSGIQCYIMDL